MRKLRVYKKTVSIIDETAIDMYENLVGRGKGFLLESYDKNYDRYTFLGPEPEEIITSRGNSLVITRADGSEEVRKGNPLTLLKDYYSSFDVVMEHEELSFHGGLVGNLGYDFIRYAEELPDANPDEIGIETIQLMLMTRFWRRMMRTGKHAPSPARRRCCKRRDRGQGSTGRCTRTA